MKNTGKRQEAPAQSPFRGADAACAPGRLTDNERLTRARTQYFILQSAAQEREEFARGLRRRGMDALPRTGLTNDAMEREVIRREMLEERCRQEKSRLDRYQTEARRLIGRMEMRRALFATRRYIYCEEMKAIKAALAGSVSPAQIDRYKKEIEG